MQRLKRRPDRLLILAERARKFAQGDVDLVADLYREHAAICESKAAEQERRRKANDVKQLGIGLSVYVEMTAIFGSEFGSVEIHDDGTVTVLTGTSPHGQGHETAWAMLVADQLGVPIESIRVLHGDTDVVPRGEGTMGSRSLQLGGTAVHGAAEAVVELAKERAGQQLEANPEDIVIDKERGVLHVAGTPSVSVSWAELAATSPLAAEYDFTATGGTYPFGAHLVVVEVDLDTGRVEVLRLVAVDDAGRILNPLLADGQVHGGLAQGVAQALLEEFVYDADGNPLTTTFADYGVVSATDGDSQKRGELRGARVSTVKYRFGFERDPDVAKISLIGAGMKSHPGVAADMFDALAEADINIEIISTSSIRVSCVIRAAQVERAVQVVHDRFQSYAEERVNA